MTSGYPSVDQYQYFDGDPKLKDFLQNVFKQVDTEKYMEIYHNTVTQRQTTKEEIYKTLLSRAREAQGNFFTRLRMALNALKEERKTLAENVSKVMDPNRPKNGYCEVGLPGRMIKVITPMMGLAGEVSVVNETSDIFQSGLPRPYQKFHTLTYEKLPLDKESCDVISCFAGLHHCPPEKLDDFIDSIYNSLREGGIFLLRDHDTHNKEMVDLGWVIHSVFNSATSTTADAESIEVRNFKSIQEWKNLLLKHGFACVSEPLKRQGDSTENVLLKFVKLGSKDDYLNIVREKLISEKNSYTRPRERTHLTTTEWFNVESSQNLGKYSNFWDYPYFRDLGELWKNLGRSWTSARKVEPFLKVIKSEATLVSGVITTLMTIEYLAKGIICSIFWAFAQINRLLSEHKKDKNWDSVSQNYQQWLNTYGQELEKTPYYAQSYVPFIKEYWDKFAESWKEARKTRSFVDLTFDRQTLKNVVTGIAVTFDMMGRAATATPINAFLGGQENGDDRKIGLIVKGNFKLPEEMKAEKEVQVEGNPYSGIVVPRYKELEKVLRELAKQGATVVEIAGQTEIQLDILVDKTDQKAYEGKLYERIYLPDESKKIVALNVKVNELQHYLNGQFVVNRIYDF